MRTKQCECGESILFLDTKKGGTIPVNASTVNDIDLKAHFYGDKVLFSPKEKGHISHFATCPKAAKFRTKSR